MKVLFVDIDTLRPDHMGCYGYRRNTTPCMDEIASDGIAFNQCYTPNAPCLPSRACLVSGQYGIHNGCVGHGGTAGDMRIDGAKRGFTDRLSENNLFHLFREAGCRTASVSTFADRHSAWWFQCGFDETINVGGRGMESAEHISAAALDWLERNSDKENWLLHVHYWDPHTPYRAPAGFGNPFENEPLADDWITAPLFQEHLAHIGPHGPKEIAGWSDTSDPNYPRHPGHIDSLKGVKHFIDGYDCGVRYADDNLKLLIDLLKLKKIYDDLVIVITSDHGENLGELGIYGEHGTADYPTCHIPLIVKWPGGPVGIHDDDLRLNIDLAPTFESLLGVKPHDCWDGESFSALLLKEEGGPKRECAILGQCAHVCQRSARFGDFIYIRTIHSGYHLFPDEMLFDVVHDPHQLYDLAPKQPALCAQGAKHILDWEIEMMRTSDSDVDPMWTVVREGGPFHSRGQFNGFIERLKTSGRDEGAKELERRYPSGTF